MSLSFSARWVWSETPRSRASSADGPHQVARDRERRAGRQHDAAHRVARRIVPAARSAARCRARIASSLSTTSSGGRPPRLRPTLMLPRAAWKRMPMASAASIEVVEPRAVREQVEMVARRGAARQHQLGHRSPGRDLDHLGREPGPEQVEVREPAEQLGVLGLGHGAGQALVHVVVGVDQPGHHHVAAQVDRLGLAACQGLGVDRRQLRPWRRPRRSPGPRSRPRRRGFRAAAASMVTSTSAWRRISGRGASREKSCHSVPCEVPAASARARSFESTPL